MRRWSLADNWAMTILALLGAVVAVLWVQAMSSSQPVVRAADSVCRAALVIDRSGSVGEPNLNTIRNQVTYLFQVGGLHSERIQLAFWSFSSGGRTANYDAPFHGFVSSKDGDMNSNFRTNLAQMVSSGATNYEQGFGFNAGVPNTFDGMNTIIDQANIIVFMTDGVPNVPGVGDNNSTARNAARQAVLKHRAAGKLIVGGIVGNESQSSLNYVINGADSNATNTFRISTNYNDLSDKLKEIIGTKCDELFPPNPSEQYSLVPKVTTQDRIISGTASATFDYSVDNSSATGSSSLTDWSIKRVIVARGQSVEPLFFGNPPYRDGFSCDQLESLVSDKGKCEDVISGQKIFAPGTNSLSLDAASATNVTIDDQWGVGTKLCYVLTISKPTQAATPTNRYSRAECVTIGKNPFVQVHGGDVWVGRRFVGDTIEQDEQNAKRSNIHTSVTPKTDGRIYGSWAEYGVFAPGIVTGFASLSGLEGGFESSVASQSLWSKLTFGNKDNTFGEFTDSNSTQGTIPDAAAAILTGRDVVRDLNGVDTVNVGGADAPSGLYKKQSGDLKIGAGVIEKRKTIIINVPDGTATIDGNVTYNNGPYGDISEIPQLVIIAKNIAIEPGVTNVDAWLIASDKNGGTVSTCNDPGTLTSEICNAPLTINGAIMARKLDLRRTGGAGAGGAAGDPAEVINLRADAYLWSQSEGRSGVRARTTHTIELPPYF